MARPRFAAALVPATSTTLAPARATSSASTRPRPSSSPSTRTTLKPTPTNHCVGAPTVAQIGTCYVSEEQGFPTDLTTTFNPFTDNVTYIPRNTRYSYVESYFLSIQRQLAKSTLLDIAYVGNHGLKLQGFINASQINPALGLGYTSAARPFPKFSDITEALNEFYSNYNSLQVRYEQRFTAGLTTLNSLT